jgi:putative heme degradation protein
VRNPNIHPVVKARLLKTAAENPEMTNSDLAARFGVSSTSVASMLHRAGIRMKPVTTTEMAECRGLKRAIAKHRRAL